MLRDLRGLHDFEPAQQQWASELAALLIEARDAASAARQAGESVLDAAVLDRLVTRYRALAVRGWPQTCTGEPQPRRTLAPRPPVPRL